MADRYFENFPKLLYKGQECTDITRRAVVKSTAVTSPFVFHPYELQHQMRPDIVAHFYYNSSYLEWLIFLSNKIIDPYYEWYQNYDTFEQNIIEKYGSIERAQRLVKFYRSNWAEDTNQLSVNYFNNNLALPLRKHYEPIYGLGLNIVGYKRKEIDTVQNTNQIWNYTVSGNGATFSLGEPVIFKNTGTETQIGTGEIEFANSTVIRVKNVSGEYVANSTVTLDIIGFDTSSNVQSSNGQNWFFNISNTEFDFYTPVTYYDYEIEENEDRKNLNLIGDGVAGLYTSEFESLMQRDVDEETGRVE